MGKTEPRYLEREDHTPPIGSSVMASAETFLTVPVEFTPTDQDSAPVGVFTF